MACSRREVCGRLALSHSARLRFKPAGMVIDCDDDDDDDDDERWIERSA